MKSKICLLHSKQDLRIEEETTFPPDSGEVLVEIGAGGICGSDLHYYHDGGFGKIRLKEPLILGHEIAGVVKETGKGVTRVKSGDVVSINPSHPCGQCEYCKLKRANHCSNIRFLGSAIRFPHTQGGFRSQMIVNESQCFLYTGKNGIQEASLAEPLAVCLHARNLAGNIEGKRVLVTGAGPIGCLCVAVAQDAGAKTVTIFDIQNKTLSVAAKIGANNCFNVAAGTDEFEAHVQETGEFDLMFECSAASSAIQTAARSLKPNGLIVQIGSADGLTFPADALVKKELRILGTFRFNDEFETAVNLLNEGKIKANQIITHNFEMENAVEAFKIAGDKSKSVKVILNF